ncbi:FKBP-type peptidyl-prolyl cis-trans isomerase [Criblamydia sequanensis]|uniref:Peptidyl-prolyl cis-trans isomerase n=1 Tax=Candidatus Criblamydia sequanensis CRIB-18 TaxID=1437425 RepID=A0A090D0C5_9BACT|nr:FKBP-type peptidyl-prolyl cis-trans isomerase [Criblamydia sequanensis]CDR33028.1 Peptidyl-prolyl cis-trans isomerase Mip [Criblamydia sequanensis CRIB-18]
MNKRHCLKRSFILSACVSALFASFTPSSETSNDKLQHLSAEQDNQDLDLKKLSQAFGHFIGRNLKSPGISFDVEGVIAGIRDGYQGKPAPMSDQEYESAMNKLQEKAYAALAKENMAAAVVFLNKNSREKNVKEIEPGKLQYMILSEGRGDEVQAHASPLIHYTGKYIDGTVFGSSEEVGGPITIPLDQTIPGFSKGLVGMKEGEKRRLFVHPELGYGMLGNLPPNALLIFDVEVVKASNPDSNKDATTQEDDTDDDYDDEDDFYNQ